ncbi:hypothetical protein AGMMS49975_26680 [Clostridia bacterium]|nr:hypothetical protein AGMMS49975_26680 [Clostridia bacterium]
MNELRFENEKKYQVAIAMAKSMREKNILTGDEFWKIDTFLLKKYSPVLGGLLSSNPYK